MLSFPTCIVSRASRTSYLLLCSTCLKLYLLSCLMPCVLSCQRVLSPTSCRESNARILLGALVPTCLVSYVISSLAYLVPCVLLCLTCFVPYVMSCTPCLVSHVPCALCALMLYEAFS